MCCLVKLNLNIWISRFSIHKCCSISNLYPFRLVYLFVNIFQTPQPQSNSRFENRRFLKVQHFWLIKWISQKQVPDCGLKNEIIVVYEGYFQFCHILQVQYLVFHTCRVGLLQNCKYTKIDEFVWKCHWNEWNIIGKKMNLRLSVKKG